MIDSFESYLKQGKAKRKTADKVEADSLLERAKKRMSYLRVLNKETAFLVVDDAYESAREAAQALMSKDGFKPYSHEATISFLVCSYKNEFEEYELREFDRFRDLRNKINYQAKEVSEGEALKWVEFTKSIIKKIEEIIRRK